jgi:hypothetical protein
MRLKEMVKAAKMKKHDIPEDAVLVFELIAGSNESDRDKEMKLVEKMDELLTEEQRLILWEYGGSCTGGETGRQSKLLGKELEGKPISEKIKIMNQNMHMYKTRLNEDGTVTAYCGCHCLQHRVTKPKTAKKPSAYGCAAGAALHNLKIALGVKANIRSIDYPREGDDKRHMTFTFSYVMPQDIT